jgi:hypothetical protein
MRWSSATSSSISASPNRMPTGVELRVHPTLIPDYLLLADVDGVMNAILVKGDAVGPTLYYGAGRRAPSRLLQRWWPTWSTWCAP